MSDKVLKGSKLDYASCKFHHVKKRVGNGNVNARCKRDAKVLGYCMQHLKMLVLKGRRAE